MKLIFMGTPAFAGIILEKLIKNSDHKIVAIFTQKPRARGRGMKLALSEVELIAKKFDIACHSPESLKTVETKEIINKIDADAIIVAAYGMIIPKSILNTKKYGSINVHPSLLPKYRGPAPMQHSLLNMDNETGVCIMQMDAGIDTGDVLMKERFALKNNITYSQLHDICAHLGADLLIKTLDNIDHITPEPQEGSMASSAPKLSKNDARIDWNMPARMIDARIRALNPWPGTYFLYKNKRIKILEASYNESARRFDAGTIIDNKITIACKEGSLNIHRLQMEGKKPLASAEFIRGFEIIEGEKLN